MAALPKLSRVLQIHFSSLLKKSDFHLSPRLLSGSASTIASKERSADADDGRKHPIYTSEHDQLRSSLRKLIDREINPYVEEWENAKEFPAHQVFKLLGNAGFLGVSKPVEYGGMGLDYSYSTAVSEELGEINCGGVTMAIGVQTDMATPALASFGSEELKRQFLTPSISGDLVSCIGVSETGGGSDVASVKTKAVKSGGDYIINGGKMWITNGAQADWMCLLANTSDGQPYSNKSLICLPLKLPGVHVAKKIDKMGMYCSDTAQLFFEDVRVPQSYLIGEEGKGFTYQMIQFQAERLFAAAAAIAPLQNAINDTIEYTSQRNIFGQPLLDNQVVHFRLAELQTEVELLRALLYQSVALYIQGNDVTKYASMLKLKAGRLTREITDACLQYWGGMGFTNDVLISRRFREGRLLSIGGGADEVMLSIICKYMGTLPKPPKLKSP